MGGEDNKQEGMFSYVSPEKGVPADHPLRPIRQVVDEVLQGMSPQFAKLYSEVGRPSIAPERLLRALLLQIFYTVRSERLLMEQLQYNLLFRWFVGMEMDEAVWNHAVFSKNRERLLNEETAEAFFKQVLAQAKPAASGSAWIRSKTSNDSRSCEQRCGAVESVESPLELNSW
jgi:transposase